MSMIKRGDGTTGRIVEAVDGDEKGMCSSCGHLFLQSEMVDGKCGACTGDGSIVEAKDVEEDPKPCCCGGKAEA